MTSTIKNMATRVMNPLRGNSKAKTPRAPTSGNSSHLTAALGGLSLSRQSQNGGGNNNNSKENTDNNSGEPASSSERRPESHLFLNSSDGDNSPIPHQVTTNEYVLNVAFFSFLGFLLVQTVFALIAHSQSMLADSQAMAVDALTYLFNLWAERIKHRPFSDADMQLSQPKRQHKRELQRLYLELIPPLISVIALLTVTIMTLHEACSTLFAADYSNAAPSEDVSVTIMLLFSFANLLLDMVNVACFARVDSNYGMHVVSEERQGIRASIERWASGRRRSKQDKMTQRDDGNSAHSNESANNNSNNNNNTPSKRSSLRDVLTLSTGAAPTESTPLVPAPKPPPLSFVNLNMCSAWTHVCADTLRSAAVLVAAGIATVFSQISGETADAVAAIAVSLIILASLLPLGQGLVLTAIDIRVLSKQGPAKRSSILNSTVNVLKHSNSGNAPTPHAHSNNTSTVSSCNGSTS